MIDTHTHIYVEEFNQDLADVIERARSVGINKLYLPNINEETIADMLSVCDSYPDICFPMIGLHPTDLEDDYRKQLTIMKNLLDQDRLSGKNRFVAIGETGLDLYWDNTRLAEQIDAFTAQIEWGLEYNLPVIIHSRCAFYELCKVMDDYKNSGLRGVFHCFSGDNNEALRLLEYPNFMLGIGGTVTYKKSILPESLKSVPLNRVVLETDAPYLPPVPFRGKRNEPAYLIKVVECLSQLYSCSPEDIISATTANAETVFCR